MKSKNLLIGIVLIFLGAFWMLDNMGLIHWSIWSVLSQLWPLILIVVGVNIIFSKVKYIRLITWGIFFILFIVFGLYQQLQYGNEAFLNGKQDFILEKRAETKQGELNLQLGGGNLDLNGTDDKLLKAYIPNPGVQNKVKFENENENVVIDFEQRKEMIKIGTRKTYNYKFHLNKDIVWDLKGQVGAVNGTFDLSELYINKIDLDVGAANMKIIMGDRAIASELDINGGATNIDFIVPENVGVRVNMEGVLKDTNLDNLGWNKIDNYYLSPNYEKADRRIDIDIDLAIGRFNVIVN